MRWILTRRAVGDTLIVTLWDTSLFRFYELRTPANKEWRVSTGHANFAGQEARSFWTQLAHVVGSSNPVGAEETRQSEMIANERFALLMLEGLDGAGNAEG